MRLPARPHFVSGDGGVHFRLSAVAFRFYLFLVALSLVFHLLPFVHSFKRFIGQSLCLGPDLQSLMLTDTYT